MIVILGVLAAIALLVLIVYALHRFQQKEKEESVDRNSPLPPLKLPPALAEVKQESIGTDGPQDWQLVVKQLKGTGEYRQALAICRTAYPNMGAFKQACVLLRAEIRDSLRRGDNAETSISELYKVCAMAALFHERTPGMQPLSPRALKRLRYEEFERLEMPYTELGFEHLKLLTASDVKMLVEIWGAPSQHRHARELHKTAWQQIVGSLDIN